MRTKYVLYILYVCLDLAYSASLTLSHYCDITAHYYFINTDGVLRDFEENFVDLWLWIVAFILSIGGIGFAVVCIVFDLLFSKKR